MTAFKYLLTRVGAKCSKQTIHRLNAALNYLETGRWFQEHGFDPERRFKSRTDIFEFAAAEIADKQVLYLEFGVHEGESIRYWSRLLRNPRSVLRGFDSFEGLPEDWNLANGKGHFSTNGHAPQITDSRVAFIKGWFDQTLPNYAVPAHEVLFITLDADLYSSTKTVLNALAGHIIKPGTYLYFDEFTDRAHELRAFDEFLNQTGIDCRFIGGNPTLARVLFQVRGVPIGETASSENADLAGIAAA